MLRQVDSIRHILREVAALLLLTNWRLHDLYDTLQADPQRACYTSTTPCPDLLRKYRFRRAMRRISLAWAWASSRGAKASSSCMQWTGRLRGPYPQNFKGSGAAQGKASGAISACRSAYVRPIVKAATLNTQESVNSNWKLGFAGSVTSQFDDESVEGVPPRRGFKGSRARKPQLAAVRH